jgi:dTMP kinase
MLITLEGIEGSGKTTQIAHILRFLQEKGYDCIPTREPGGTRIGQEIRAILLDPDHHEMEPLTELLLYAADRAQHVKEIIRPCLSSGKIVVCDRFLDATTVYQGYARGLDTELINRLHDLVLNDLRPDITLLLDVPPEIGLKRAWSQVEGGVRADRETRFEKEQLSFHRKVRAGYLEAARREPGRFRVIDAGQGEEAVRNDILNELLLVLEC